MMFAAWSAGSHEVCLTVIIVLSFALLYSVLWSVLEVRSNRGSARFYKGIIEEITKWYEQLNQQYRERVEEVERLKARNAELERQINEPVRPWGPPAAWPRPPDPYPHIEPWRL